MSDEPLHTPFGWYAGFRSAAASAGALVERQVDRLARLMNTQAVAAGGAAAVLLALALYSLLVAGFDLSRFMTGDALYPVQVQLFPLLEFRPPPSNNLFPDVLVHLAIGPFVADPLWQKMIAGWVLFGGMMVAIGAFKGPAVAVAVSAVLALTGFGFLDTTSHYTLPLTVLAFQLVRNRLGNNFILFIVVFSDLLVLLPLIVLVLLQGDDRRLPERIAIVALAYLGNAFYSEFSEALMKITLFLPFFALGALAARHFGMLRLFAMAVTAALVVLAIAGLEAERYALAVAASMLVVLAPNVRRSVPIIPAAFSLIALGIFAGTADAARLDLHNRQYDCLLNELNSRDSSVLAADHWVAKPLFFSARARGQALTIAQTDFAEGDSSNWMAPHAFAGEPTPFAVKSNTICGYISEPNAFCTRENIAEIVSRINICEGLELITYAREVPIDYQPQAASKAESVLRNLGAYLEKVGIGRN